MIQLNLKPNKLLPSVFTSQPVIARDTLKTDYRYIDTTFGVYHIDPGKDHFLGVFGLQPFTYRCAFVGARGCMFKWEVLSLNCESREMGSCQTCSLVYLLLFRKRGSRPWFSAMCALLELIQ